MKQGVEGIQKALKVLNDYYAKDSAHSSADGAGSGIIGLLSNCFLRTVLEAQVKSHHFKSLNSGNM